MSQPAVKTTQTEAIPARKFMWNRILSITWPAFFENIMSGLFNMADMMMLGWVTPVYIAAAGLTNQPFFICNAVFFGVNVGATAMVAWAIGGKELERARTITAQAIGINAMLGVTLFILAYFMAGPVVKFMGANEDTYIYAKTYLQFRAIGLIFISMTFAITAAMRGAGETKIPMFYNLIANFLNVFFNYILIFGKLGFPALGIAGAAIATSFSQLIALAIALLVLLKSRMTVLKINIKDCFKIQKQTAAQLFKIGIPSSIEQFIMQTGFMLYAKTVASLGTIPLAAHQIGLNINIISFAPAQAFSVAATTLTGQSLGANMPKTAKKYIRYVQQLAVVVGIFTGAVIVTFSRQLAGFYTSDLHVINLTAGVLIYLAVAQPGQTTQLSISGALRGAGDTLFPLVSVAISVWGMRVVLSYLFVKVFNWGLSGAWLAITFDQYCRAIIVYIRYYSGKWMNAKRRKLVVSEEIA